MLHVLDGNLAQLAASRYVTPDEIEKAEEELTVKLCNIIIWLTNKQHYSMAC